jgi:DtxR family Mn-dependent transcriptional regulator
MWIKTEEEGLKVVKKDELLSTDFDLKSYLEELLENRLISVKKGNVSLTKEGRKESRDIIRRHRLAERLLVDVLEMAEEGVEEAACRFEHALPVGVDESVCTLLGHPKLCPDGNPIPPGNCCMEGREKIERLITPLSDLETGTRGKIAYITSKKHQRLQRLMAMGVIPGLPLRLLQKYPSFVIQIEETQIALDKELADEIFVRREKLEGE